MTFKGLQMKLGVTCTKIQGQEEEQVDDRQEDGHQEEGQVLD